MNLAYFFGKNILYNFIVSNLKKKILLVFLVGFRDQNISTKLILRVDISPVHYFILYLKNWKE